MSEEAYRQLKALLFGQSPYDRYSAPEPELLTDLAPALDASLLAYAYQTLRDIAFMRGPERLRGLVQLLERAGVDNPEWLSYFGQALWRYPHLAGEIPEDLLPSALRAIGSVEWHDERRVMVLSATGQATRGIYQRGGAGRPS